MLSYLLLALVAWPAPVQAEVRQFGKIENQEAPRSLFQTGEVCSETDNEEECREHFVSSGWAWRGDVNADGRDEFLIHSGSDWRGTGGYWVMLFEEQDGKWVSILGDGWSVQRTRLDILPVNREGYSDLRLTVDDCFKWAGKQYVHYEPSDYHSLSPTLFDSADLSEAEIFWAIRYSGRDAFQFEPQWFALAEPLTDENSERIVDDPDYGVRWVLEFKGGVYGVGDGRAFLLLPRPTYQGAGSARIEGDWLVLFKAWDEENPPVLARYNRKTREMRIGSAQGQE